MKSMEHIQEKIKRQKEEIQSLDEKLKRKKMILKSLENEKKNLLIHDRIERNEKIIQLLELEIGKELTEESIHNFINDRR